MYEVAHPIETRGVHEFFLKTKMEHDLSLLTPKQKLAYDGITKKRYQNTYYNLVTKARTTIKIRNKDKPPK